MTQHKAFRLADDLESGWCPVESPSQMKEAAAELRRLHAENERLHQINQSHEMKLSVRGYEIQIADLEAQRDALLEALREIGKYTGEGSTYSTPWQDIVADLGQKARAAIKAAEENT